VDLQPGSDRVLSWAADLAEAFGARLTVIHAVAAGERHPEVYYLEADLRRYLMEQAKEKIASMLRNTACPAANVHVDAGNITSVVRSAAEDRGAQLLVIGRSSRPGAGGNFSTNSYGLIRESPCPVVSI
jgi:nucleotide-binding universal stress UspA family protein